MKFLKKLTRRFKHEDSTNPSVNDFTNTKDLRSALTGGSGHGKGTRSRGTKQPPNRWDSSPSTVETMDDATIADHASDNLPMSASSSHSDAGSVTSDTPNTGESLWKISNADAATSKPQCMEDEMKRLQVLQSYFLLDSHGSQEEKEQSQREFDRITRLAQMLFPSHDMASLISLVDLGRLYWLSQVGMQDDSVFEMPRNIAFCAHAILNQKDMLLVEDTTKDPRFANNVLVTEPPHVRFYAGVALKTPEGYNIGTLCTIGTKDGMNGPIKITANQIAQLRELGDLVVDIMVSRRERFIKREYERRTMDLAEVFRSTSSTISKTAQELRQLGKHSMTTLQAKSALSKAIQSLTMQAQICSATTRTLMEQDPELAALDAMHGSHSNASSDTETSGGHSDRTASGGNGGPDETINQANGPKTIASDIILAPTGLSSMAAAFQDDLNDILYPIVDMVQLYTNLDRIMASFPKTTTTTIEFVKGIPKKIVAEDLLLFKSCLFMLTETTNRFSRNGASNHTSEIHLRVRTNNTRDDLIVECEQNATAETLMTPHQAKALFASKKSLLHSVSTMVKTMGGTAGFFQGKLKDAKGTPNNIIWFKMPLQLPEQYDDPWMDSSDQSSEAASAHRAKLYLAKALKHTHHDSQQQQRKQQKQQASLLSPRTMVTTGKTVFRQDPLQAHTLMRNSCVQLH